MDEAGVREMVARHDEAIVHVTNSIERLATAVEKTDDKMDKVIEALGQNAVILEKIANIDSSNKDSVNRLHRRIDDVLTTIELKENLINKNLQNVQENANKGSKVYDLIVFTAKTLAWAVPIISALAIGLMWFIDHIIKG